DFTHPWFDAGLRIMINEDRGTGFRDMFQGLQASGHLRAYAWIAAVISGEVAAVLGDAPVLEYYAHSNKQLPLSVVGAIFEPDKYGFGLPHGSDLTRALTVELIGAHEGGRIEEIRQKYFGDSP